MAAGDIRQQSDVWVSAKTKTNTITGVLPLLST
jgi:hypothetical protein